MPRPLGIGPGHFTGLAAPATPFDKLTSMYIQGIKSCKFSKWGNSLAVRLPAAVVEALGLREGDQVAIQVAGKRAFEVSKAPGNRELLVRLRKFRGRLPASSDSIVSKRMSAADPFFDTSVLL